MLENDWEILQCNLGTFYHDDCMHAPGRYSALVLQTKRQGWTPRRSEQDSDRLASTPYSSSQRSSNTVAARVVDVDMGEATSGAVTEEEVAKVNLLTKGAPAYRMFDEGIPLYDGRTGNGTKGFQFGARDWESYETLPLYPYPEVEEGSLVTVVTTVTGFRGAGNSHHTVHFNALFAIVLGKVEL
ncbi:hypothetical protein VNI00_008958 [Paramarasmius palmivorus]|uniref:Uncharacterized protein n=1 Tax=Paramarasmius palmivorus TaxID=297713 RepID=A0AAW0CTV5_9AGAR